MKNLKKIKNEIISPPKLGEIIEGDIIAKERSEVFLDLGPKGIGIIYGKEFSQAKDILKKSKIGDKLSVKITELENENGYREVSFQQANEDMLWKELIKAKENNETFDVLVRGSNKGGLLCQIKGIDGFLPSSQLTPEHYPKIKDADPAKIAQALQKFVGQTLKVSLYSIDPKEKKLILSEKSQKKEKAEKVSFDYQEGQEYKVKISGLTGFGAFVKLPDDTEGLVYSSEMPESTNLQIGDKIQAKIIKIEGDRIYLSMK